MNAVAVLVSALAVLPATALVLVNGDAAPALPRDGHGSADPVVLAKEEFHVSMLAGQTVTFEVPAGDWDVYAQFRFTTAAIRDFAVDGPGHCTDAGLAGAVFLGNAGQTFACGQVDAGPQRLDLALDAGFAEGTVTVYALPG